MSFNADFQCVASLRPGKIFRGLISVLDEELRSIGVGADLGASKFIPTQVRKAIQAGIAQTRTSRSHVIVAIESEPEFVGQSRRKSMIFTYSNQVVVIRRDLVKCRECWSVIDAIRTVVNVAPSQLVLFGNVVVQADNASPIVRIRCTGDGRGSNFDRSEPAR